MYCLICNKRFKEPETPEGKRSGQLFCATHNALLTEEQKLWAERQFQHVCKDCNGKGRVEVSEVQSGVRVLDKVQCKTCEGSGWVA